jgi:hypothetical protein
MFFYRCGGSVGLTFMNKLTNFPFIWQQRYACQHLSIAEDYHLASLNCQTIK